MNLGFLIPACLGVLSALQGIANRRLLGLIGLPATVGLNALIVAFLAAALFIWHKSGRSLEVLGELAVGDGSLRFQWWWLTGGLCGFAIISFLPVAIARMGASLSFVLFVAFQVVAGLIYDLYFGGRSFSAIQACALAATLLGVAGLVLAR